MRKTIFTAMTAAALATGPGALAQTYSNAVMALNPAAYWPLQETTGPSSAGLYVATNLGTLGAAGQGYYQTWWQTNATSFTLTNLNSIVHITGAIAGDSDPALSQGQLGEYVVIPRATNGVANAGTTITAPFTIEAWIYPTNASANTLKPIISEGFNTVQATNAGYINTTEGTTLGMYSGFLYFSTFNGPNSGTKTEIDTVTLALNHWYHIAATFNGTAMILYTNGVSVKTNTPPANAFGQTYVPDLVSPLVIGGGNEPGGSGGASDLFGGGLDEVAIYNSALSSVQVTNHYRTATNSAPTIAYKQVVLNDNPAIYLRLDEPAFTGPSALTAPVANNYGSLGSAANGYYLSGAAPGAAGPTYPGFGAGNTSVALNGFNSVVDIGGGNLPAALNPMNNQPVTVTAWFKGSPADCVTRFQTLVGHSSASWRLSMDDISGLEFNPGNGPQLQFTYLQDELNFGTFANDGNWHFVAGVSDGANDYLYIDGRLAKSATGVGSVGNGSPQDVILGGDPQYLVPAPISTGGVNRDFDGSLAHVAIFTNALTASQIQGIYGAAGVPLSIVLQPASHAFISGTNGSIPAVVAGASGFQWYYQGGGEVAGETTASLTFNPVMTGSAGSYYLVASNNWGAVTSAVVQVTVYQSQSGAYANAVQQLNPAAYWPLNETAQPPQPLNLTAVNFGTLGAAGNGEYGAWYQPSGNTWYLTNNIVQTNGATYAYDSSKGMWCQGAPGQYVIVPRNTNGVYNAGLSLTPPFSIEAWVRVGTTNSTLGDIVSQGGTVNLNTGGPNPANPFYGGLTTNWAGIELGQFQDYFFFLVQSTNGYQSKASELDTSGYNTWKGFRSNQWVHLVATFSVNGGIGTQTIYTNGVQCVTHTGTKNGTGQYYVADPTTPIMIAAGSDVTAVYGANFTGTIDDVAIYPELLPLNSITNHYAVANGNFSTFSSYTNAVLADNPLLYYRLNDPQTQTNAGYASSTFPVATNYGTVGFSGNGVYQPGTTPGVAGPPFAGFGSNSTAVAFNGWLGSVDVGSSNLPVNLNPNAVSPLTVVTWFQTGPADAPGRFQDLLGHGNNSYRLTLGQAAGENHFNPGPGPELQFISAADVATNGFAFNDGNWHMAAGVSDGTNDYLYLDGLLARSGSTASGINIPGSATDLLIGGDSQFTTASPNTANTIRTFDGQLAQVAFWNNALTLQQIQSLYNAAAVPPSFYQSPLLSQTLNAGQNLTNTAVVRGSGPIAYQWYQNGSAVAGQTNASLIYAPAVAGNTGSYVLVASSSSGSITSSVVNIVVYGPPTVVQQTPAQLDIFAGSSPILHVSAAGATPIYYQWSSNSIPIAGATNSSYPLANLQSSATFGCFMTNFVGTNSITPIVVTVLTDPTAPFPSQVLSDGPEAYYRLDESAGTTAYDYVGGNNATYTNVALGMPGYTSEDAVNSDPTETAAGFGFISPPNDYAGNVPTYLNFGTTNGGNAEFSAEAWITEYEYANGGDCIVGLGYGGGGEQFILDTGSGTAGDLRFFVRNAAGTVSAASSTNYLVNDGLWHHVVGVCDEAGGHVYVYLDGKQVASGTITAGSGLLSSSVPLSIGARQSGNNGNTNYDYQFYGSVDDVAVYNKALSAAQVQAHYLASGVPPLITGLQPSSNWTTNQGANVVLTVAASGTPPLSYQWLDNDNNPIPWGTNATLVITNVQPSQAGTYTVNVTNYYGGPVSTNVNLTVSQVPQLVSDITPSNVTVYATVPITLSVSVSGTLPLSYQWYKDGVAIPNATNTTYSFGALLGSNTYYLLVTNIYSAGNALQSSTATVVGMPATFLTPTNYTDNLKITFAGYNRSETLQDFPVLVQLGTNLPGFNYNHFASPTGGDLRFTDSGGTRVIPSEIDQWDTSGESEVWVQVPALSGTNTTIWAYWGNPSATNPLPGTNVWVPQSWEGLPAYDVVYHLKEGALPFADSTGQYPALTGVAPAQTAGVVGTGAAFDGATTFLDAGLVSMTKQFSVSAWVNIVPAATSEQTIWCNKQGGWNTAGFDYYVDSYQTNDRVMYFDSADGVGGSVPARTVSQAVGFGQWHFLTGTLDGINGATHVYIDGVDQTISTATDDALQVTNYVRLGALLSGTPGATGGLVFDGAMDEARIHAGIEDSNWVWASYMTVQQNSSLETYSAIASTAPAEPVAIKAEFTAGSLNLSGTGGSPGANYYVVGSTNLTVPVALWPVLYTSNFDGSGNFNATVPVNVTTPTLFLRIKQ